MTDPLAEWWVHPVAIKRWNGDEAYGLDFDAPVTVLGFVRDGSKLVAGANGEQVTSTAQVAFPAGTPYIPVQSEVTLPAQFGGRTSRVVVSAVGDGGGQPTPDHVEIALL